MRPDASDVWVAPYDVDLGLVLGPFARGSRDPSTHRAPGGQWWRAARTPDGPATLHLGADGRSVHARAWGPGASWAVASVPALLGVADDPHGFPVAALPEHLREHAAAVLARWRVPSSGLVLDALVPAVLEQKVTGVQSRRSLHGLLQSTGEPAPGPAPRALIVPPDPGAIARIPSWDWHRWGVEPFQARTLTTAARVAGRLEECCSQPRSDARARLLSVPGIGAWTAAEVAARAWGDPDAVSFGDYHLAAGVVYAFTGRRDGDDDAMAAVLEPFAGHRHRVQRIVETSGISRPARGPRMTVPDHRDR